MGNDNVIKRRRALSLVAGSLMFAPALRSRAAEAVAIRIALVASDSASLCEYGCRAGFLESAGLPIEVQYLGNGPAAIAALLGGTIDVTPVNSLTLLQAREKGFALSIIGAEAVYRAGQASTMLMVPKDSSARVAADLNGKTIAVSSLQSNPHVAVMNWLDKNGGNSKTVKYAELPFAAMPAALEAKRVDAAMIAEPGLTGSLPFARLFADAYGSYGSVFLMDCFVATTSWCNAHPQETRHFSKAMLATAAWANHHRRETGAVLASTLNVDPHLIASMRRAVFGEAIEPALLEPVITAGLTYGALTKPVAASTMFSPYVL